MNQQTERKQKKNVRFTQFYFVYQSSLCNLPRNNSHKNINLLNYKNNVKTKNDSFGLKLQFQKLKYELLSLHFYIIQ